jgi:hypothetical protein
VAGVANGVVAEVRRRRISRTKPTVTSKGIQVEEVLLLAVEIFAPARNPNGEVREVRDVKELARDIYAPRNKPADARRSRTCLIDDCREATAEICGLARTVKTVERSTLVWRTTRCLEWTAPEGTRLHHRIRIVRACGGCN